MTLPKMAVEIWSHVLKFSVLHFKPLVEGISENPFLVNTYIIRIMFLPIFTPLSSAVWAVR